MAVRTHDDNHREYYGKSTDKKPMPDPITGLKITTGSVFVEIDTLKVYFFDEDSQAWLLAK